MPCFRHAATRNPPRFGIPPFGWGDMEDEGESGNIPGGFAKCIGNRKGRAFGYCLRGERSREGFTAQILIREAAGHRPKTVKTVESRG